MAPASLPDSVSDSGEGESRSPDITRQSRLDLEYFSQPLKPRELGQDADFKLLDTTILDELATSLSGSDSERDLNAGLASHINFVIFQKTDDLTRLERAIKQQQRFLASAQVGKGHLTDADARYNLTVFLAQKFEKTGVPEDLDNVIFAAELANSIPSAMHLDEENRQADMARLRAFRDKLSMLSPKMASSRDEGMDTLAMVLGSRDMVEALNQNDYSFFTQKLKHAMEDPTLFRMERLRLAEAFAMASIMKEGGDYKADRGPNSEWDCTDLITNLEVVREDLLAPELASSRCTYFGVLGTAYYVTFNQKHDEIMLQKAEKALESAIEVPADITKSAKEVLQEHPMWTVWSVTEDIHTIIERLLDRQFLNASRAFYVGYLGMVKKKKYEISRAPANLVEAVRLLEESWADAADKGRDAETIGMLLVASYNRCLHEDIGREKTSIINSALFLIEELLTFPLPSALRQQALIHQCAFYLYSFMAEGGFDVLDRAIELSESVRAELDYGHSQGPTHLGTLMELYIKRAETFLDSTDLNRAFQVAADALDMADAMSEGPNTSKADIIIAQARALDELANCFVMRYHFTRHAAFLSEAAKLATRSIEVSRQLDDGDPNRTVHLTRLGYLRGWLCRRTGNGEELSNSIEWCREAIKELQGTDEELCKKFELDLALHLATRYWSDPDKYEADQDEIMRLKTKIIDPGNALSFCRIFLLIYSRNNDLEVLNAAVDTGRMAVSESRASRAAQPSLSDANRTIQEGWAYEELSLAQALVRRIKYNGKEGWSEDADTALDCLLRCVRAKNIDIAVLIWGAQCISEPLFVSSGKLDMSDLALATGRAVRSLPKALSRTLRREDVQHLLNSFAGVATDAAAAAIASGRGAEEALELLETGRGILTTHLLDLRVDQGGTGGVDDGVASRLRELAQLDKEMDLVGPSSEMSGFQVNRAYELNTEIDRILAKRKQSTDHSSPLLRPPKVAEMRKGIGGGAIVVVNASFRCDAIIIKDGEVDSLSLPHLSHERAQASLTALELIRKRSSNRSLRRLQVFLGTLVLEWLWHAAVEPILNRLGFTTTPGPNEAWPRVWWIPTGWLSQMPFHAAGIHRPRSSSSTLDRVISSYSSSIQTLLYTQHNMESRTQSKGAHGEVALVPMITTPGQRSLPYVGDEIRAIKAVLPPSVRAKELKKPCKKNVLEALKTCDVFHFAGHGATFIDDPDRSCLYLSDWQTDPLTVRDILALRLHERCPRLAYLSACSTGANRTPSLQDEAVHLVSACQLAGFQNVIGSFWEVSDFRSREVAESVYARLNDLSGEPDVALALHLAVRKLREPKSEGTNGAIGADGRLASEVEDDSMVEEELGAEDESEDDEGVEVLLDMLRDTGSFGYTSEEWDGIRDGGKARRRQVSKRDSMSNPVFWAPYFHVGL